MIKTCSLDFLNKENFETDVLTSDGRILCSSGDKVTPESILRLYFKEIYIKEEPKIEEAPNKASEEEVKKEELVSQVSSMNIESAVGEASIDGADTVKTKIIHTAESEDKIDDAHKPGIIDSPDGLGHSKTAPGISYKDSWKQGEKKDETAAKDIEEDELNKPLEFDEASAQKNSNYAYNLGKILKFSDSRLDELKKAAYYHNIGRTKFKKGDLSQKHFKTMQAIASYEVILNELKMSETIAETAKFCVENYNSATFKLNQEIPYAHIVAITSYYVNAFNKLQSKEDVLDRMLQLGGNKFNTFVLHKFIRLMKETNE